MSATQKLKKELVAVMALTLYFGAWLGVLILLKYLVLAEYHIGFTKFSVALVGALVLAKVVLILEHVPLGAWVRRQPAWLDVVIRTLLYTFGVFVLLSLEKGIELRHEYGGFINALQAGYQNANVYHVWLNTLCLSGALLSYNMLSVVRRHLGNGALLKMFLAPLPEKKQQHGSEDKHLEGQQDS
jgi:hypothetical protein